MLHCVSLERIRRNHPSLLVCESMSSCAFLDRNLWERVAFVYGCNEAYLRNTAGTKWFDEPAGCLIMKWILHKILHIFVSGSIKSIQIPITRQPAESLRNTSTGFVFNKIYGHKTHMRLTSPSTGLSRMFVIFGLDDLKQAAWKLNGYE